METLRLWLLVAAMLPFALVGALAAFVAQSFMLGWEHVSDRLNP